MKLQTFLKILLPLVVISGVGAILYASTAGAQVDAALQQVGGAAPTSASPETLVKVVIDILLYIVGIVSVIMIIIGGIKYATSAGDSSKASSAQKTILYSVIGLIVAVFAYAIVQYVYSTAVGGGSANTP